MFASATESVKAMRSQVQKAFNGKSDPSTMAMLFVASVCALLPLDISQMSFAILGAVLYAFLQQSDRFSTKKVPVPTKPHAVPYKAQVRNTKPREASVPHTNILDKNCSNQLKRGQPQILPKAPAVPEMRKPSAVPIAAPTFQSQGWEAEVQELLSQITPTQEVEDIVNKLAAVMGRTIKSIIPEVEMFGFASGNLNFGKAFGVAVPEVDIVATVAPQVLYSRLHARASKSSAAFEESDAKKLQKAAIRTCTDRLVSVGGFKFRRSAFRGQEPKVTLLVPASVGLFADAIPIDFSVNVVTPLYNAALLTECGQIESRAKELILLVKRWAKDRGICHVAKGHLSPYMWGLLSIYFLQNGVGEEGPLLPPFGCFEMSSGLASQSAGSKMPNKAPWTTAKHTGPQKSVGALFKDFLHFFKAEFDWKNEAVSIRSGERAPPSSKLPLHIIVSEDTGKSQVGLSIEDPFQAAQNLGDCMNAMSFARLKEELDRAETLCTKSASLSELLEPWSPPDAETGLADIDREGDEGNADKVEPEKETVRRLAGSKQQVENQGEKDTARRPVVRKMLHEAQQGLDWRRDAAEAQGLPASKAVPPPWRR